MKKITAPIEFVDKGYQKEVGLTISKKALDILMLIPDDETKAMRKHRRLVRMRKRLFNAVKSLNRELQKHTQKELLK